MRCTRCHRTITAPVFHENLAYGPKCAAKAGLLERARRGQGQVRLFNAPRRPADPQTLDLFGAAA